MERLTKKELRALLECIKECYPICDIENFPQRVLSRLAKIIPREVTFHRGGNPPWRRNVYATYPHVAADIPSPKKVFERRGPDYPVIFHHGKTHNNRVLNITDFSTARQLGHQRLHNKLYQRLGVKHRTGPPFIDQLMLNSKRKSLAEHDKIVFKLLRPHLIQSYRNAQTFTYVQQKLTLVDRALYRLNLGLIFLTPHGKIRLATTWAMQQLTSYLGPQSLRGNRLPESLWRWVKQQEVAPRGKDDVLLRQSPLVLEGEGKRLVIRFVSDLDQSLLLLEEQPTTIQPQSLAPLGLSPREAQVLDWVAQGKTNKEIGVILELSPRTVQKHLEHIYRKIYVESRTAAAAKAYEMALLASNRTVVLSLVVISLLIT